MAGKLNTFSGRMVLVIFVIYVVSMPVLYFGLVSVLENGLAHAFVDDVRAVGRLIADNSDELLDDASGEEVIKLLDSIMLSGKNNFAAIDASTIHIAFQRFRPVRRSAIRSDAVSFF